MLIHPGTGRTAQVVHSADFSIFTPAEVNCEKYILFVASQRAVTSLPTEVARQWIDTGASYICAWGPASPQVEESFDYASFLPELGKPLSFTLMTTSHKNEELDEALWFAFYTANPPDDLNAELETVVVLVDSRELEQKCRSWVQENRE
jgi:hypothetical protein